MSFFPQAFLSSRPEQSSGGFTPLFRLLEDFDTYNRASPSQGSNAQHKTFTPKFDVREEETAYELHGELPGIEQKDIEVEFVDASTLSVRGKVEREYHTSDPTPAVEDTAARGALKDAPSNDAASEKSHQPTVADETDESKTVAAPGSENEDSQKSVQQQKNENSEQKPSVRYWTSERTYGSFARTFTFPENIDQNAVTASMKNGVLSIRVPKAPKHEQRRRISVL